MLTASSASPPEAEPGGGSFATTELNLGGMHCSACARRIEGALGHLPAVASAAVNLATTRAFVSYDASTLSVEELCRAVADAGYTAEPADRVEGAARRSHGEHWVIRAIVSWPLAIAALSVSLLAPQSAGPGWAVLLLAVTVELAGGWPFLRNAASLARRGATSMDTLIALGTLAAVSVNAVEVIALGGRHIHIGTGSGAFAERLHFAMAPLIVSILVSGRAVEGGARRRAAGAMHSLLALRPPAARIVGGLEDERGELVAPESVPVGALVRVRPNEAIPLDGTVVGGRSPVDESMLTGEPLPVDHGPDSKVTGGTRNGWGALVVRVDAPASESVLSRLERLVEEAQRDKAPLQRVADRVSRVFVPAVLLFSGGTFLLWWFVAGDHDAAVLSGLAVLLVACPCAMGLAAPMAMMVGCGRASALGIFVRSGDAIERLARVDTVVFDKTGTLTERHAVVTDLITAPGIGRETVLGAAAAVEVESDHPIAAAVIAASGPPPHADDVRVIPGVGVAGVVDGEVVRVIRVDPSRMPESLSAAVAARFARGETVVLVERGNDVMGAIAVATPVRAEASACVRRLQEMGMRTTILSGDSEPAVRTVGAELGIDDLQATLSPAGKVDAVRAERTGGHSVLMVGDGVNDAPALAAADVGCAIGTGSDAALANSDVALLGNDLGGVPAALNVARSTYAVVLQNFGWAMGYNIAALPLAAAGLIDPLVAAVAMGLSSLIVVANSLRLVRVGRSGRAAVRTTSVLGGARGLAFSVALPVVLFAGVTVLSQIVSPARGQSLLPELPTISTANFARGGSAEVYLNPGTPGLNDLHLFVYPPHGNSRIGSVSVTASLNGGTPQLLRHLRVGPGHFVNYVLLSAGSWVFDVSVSVGGRTEAFEVRRVIS